MLQAFARAVAQLPKPELRKPLLLTLAWSCLVVALFWAAGWEAFERVRHVLGAYGAVGTTLLFVVLALATWLLFTAVENTILFCYADRIAAAVEDRHYPELPRAGRAGWIDSLWSGLRLAFLTLIGNILALPFYLVPGLNLVLFPALNGYLLGRAYFDAVALRRMEDRNARRVWRAHRLEFVLNGALSAVLLTIPVLNLVVPILGLATAVHLFERLRPAAAGPRPE